MNVNIDADEIATGPGSVAEDGSLARRYLRSIASPARDAADLIASILAAPAVTDAYGDRYVTRAAFLASDQARALESDLAAIFTLLSLLPQRLFGGDRRAAGQAAGMTSYQIDAVERTATDASLALSRSLARADLYAEADGFRLLEFNIVSALGGLEIAELNRVLLDYPPLAAFAAQTGLHYADPMAGVADVIKAECANDAGGSAPVVVITDTPANFAPFAKRFEFLAQVWSGMGLEAIACPLDRFEERSGRLFADGRAVDVVYRYFLIEDLLDPDSRALIEPVLRAAEKSRVHLLSGLDAELYGSKAMLALLSDEATRAVLTGPEADLVDRLLPWTRMLREGPATVGGAPVDLLDYARAEQSGLVLKPTLLHGGIGVVPGWTVSPRRWQECLRAGLGGPYVLQRRVRPVTESFPVPGRPGAAEPLALNWGVFLIGGEYAGTLIRGSADPDVGVLSRATGAQVGCVFHEDF